MLPVVGGDLDIPLVGGSQARHANLDYAASAPSLVTVAAEVARLLPYSASVHRGAGFASQVCTSVYEGARAEVARFLGARPDDAVIFTRNTTDAVNLLARAVAHLPGSDLGGPPAGPRVVVLDLEHHANLLPWSGPNLTVLAARPTQAETLDALAAALRAQPAALVAVTGASNVTGERLPLADVVRIAHGAGARVFVDAAQLAPHRRIDLAALGIDYLALSGHKLYAPFGAGVLVGRADWLHLAPPYLAGGGAVRNVALRHLGPARAGEENAFTRPSAGLEVTWADAPARHEAGTPNLPGAAALAAACRALAALPDGALAAHDEALRARLEAGLAGLPGVRVLRLWPDAATKAGDTAPVGVVAFTVAGREPDALAAYLSAEHGISLRAGRFCAHPLLDRLGAADGALRASVGVGSTAADVDRLLAALDSYLTAGPRWRYVRGAGGWMPSPDDRRLPGWASAVPAAPTPAPSPCDA
ncbi:aminotransferase class V-fold PLP-dependent enzyme [Frankia sp. CN7]|uniref:Aminotransferase class V-fold PLP-dependent enzyme n=1 Tax=Frankia nepalensis TaxID=1836974 RepID=A0A937RE98_9ACTN|nr:aminotransferase class V-fold PLP-dependent enzyme [Frankia nepalensis]MBL7509201.1 aminotransferase class V-fold PLP-dependent enzyme [Frankia nepalensis]MBL7628392.1 aminotransferase class V-fold PLP-dependent enzyme [Frankia nepalensis]